MPSGREPLNQIYRRNKTFSENPELYKIFQDFTDFSLKSSFIRVLANGDISIRGRRYDGAMIIYLLKNLSIYDPTSTVQMSDMKVCEVGARDGILCSYLSSFVKRIYVSDNFEDWGKGTTHCLGLQEFWFDFWKKHSANPERMEFNTEDAKDLTYKDNMFDMTYATSVVNHAYTQILPGSTERGDTLAIKELCRVTKPGGLICLSITLGIQTIWKYGLYVYTVDDMYNYLINPSGCQLLGPSDFDMASEFNDAIESVNEIFPVSYTFIVLKKPSV